MLAASAQFVTAAAIIVVAATLLSRFADVIAEVTGLGRLLIGSILLAGATSLPELSVDISAARMGFPNVAVGDLMGSSLMNLLILGVIDLLPGSRGRALSRISSAHALPAALGILLTALAAAAIITRSSIGVYNIGVAGVGLALVYLFGMRMIYMDQKLSAPMHTADPALAKEAHRPGAMRNALIGFGLAAAVIVFTAGYLAQAAGELAELSGLGGTFVGTTLVALSTSLPELVASLAALRMRAPDLALGNLLGSNVFNMALLLPLDLAYPGALFADISLTHALTGLAAIVVTSVVVMGQLYQAERRVRLVEPDGWLIIVLVIGSLAMVFMFREPEEPPPAKAPARAALVHEVARR
jgi:cation:H+ antiporter